MSSKSWPKVRRRFIDCRLQNGERYQKSFGDKKDAEADAERLRSERNVERKNYAVSLANLTDDQRMDVLTALKILGVKGSLTGAAEFFVAHNDLTSSSDLSVQEALDRFLDQSAEAGLRPRSLGDLRARLGRLAESFGTRPLTHISRTEAQEWLDGLKGRTHKYTPSSKKHFRIVAGGFYNWCIERGYATLNPFAFISKGRRGGSHLEDQKLPGILNVQQVEAVLHAAETSLPEIAAALAVGFFAGLRTSELQQLRWEDVNFELGLLTVRPEVAKKRRARHVAMETNLRQWLLAFRKDSGLVAPQDTLYRRLFDRVRRAAGCLDAYPHNAMRHTFATMHLVKYQDAARTALQLGHAGGINILLDHYRALATPQEAEKFWAIGPHTETQMLRFPAVVG